MRSSWASCCSPLRGNKVKLQLACLGESGTFALLLLQVAVRPGQPASLSVPAKYHHFDQGGRLRHVPFVAAQDRPPAHTHVLLRGERVPGGIQGIKGANLSAQGPGVFELGPSSLKVFAEIPLEAHTLNTPAVARAAGGLEKHGEALDAQERSGLLLGFLSGLWLAILFLLCVLVGRVLAEVAFHARRAGRRGTRGPAGGQGVAGKHGVPRGRGGGGDAVIRFASLHFVLLVHAGVIVIIHVYFCFDETVWRRVRLGLASENGI